MNNVISLKDWKEKKSETLESLVPAPYKDLEDFLGYCRIHSESPRALFHISNIIALYKMAGYSLKEVPKEIQNSRGLENFCAAREEEMNPILEIIYRRKNSVEVNFERVE